MTLLQIAPSDLRLLSPRSATQNQFATDPGESLENVNTTNLPDGAMCYCTDNRALYILDKFSTEAALLDIIVVPNGGTGRWVLALVNPSGGVNPFAASVFLDTPPNTIDIPDNTGLWQPLDSPSQFIRAGNFFSDVFVLDLATGVLTYTGLDQNFMITAMVSIGSDGDALIDFAVDCAGTSQTALINTNATRNFSQNANYLQDTLTRINISTQRMVGLRTGNTIQGVFRNLDNDVNDLIVYKYSLVVLPA